MTKATTLGRKEVLSMLFHPVYLPFSHHALHSHRWVCKSLPISACVNATFYGQPTLI